MNSKKIRKINTNFIAHWTRTRDHVFALPLCYHSATRFNDMLSEKVAYMLTRFKR